jgi:hypothetical protein
LLSFATRHYSGNGETCHVEGLIEVRTTAEIDALAWHFVRFVDSPGERDYTFFGCELYTWI